MELYAPLLYRWNVAVGLQPADAQEVVQEVLLVVFRRLGQFEHRHPGTFRAWLKSITANKIRELRARRSRRREDASMEAMAAIGTLPDDNADFAWAERYAEDLFARACELVRPLVTPTTWRIFTAVYIERVPVDTVAKRCGVSRNAVYIAQCRCLSKLRVIVEGYLDDSLQAPLPESFESGSGDGIAD